MKRETNVLTAEIGIPFMCTEYSGVGTSLAHVYDISARRGCIRGRYIALSRERSRAIDRDGTMFNDGLT